MRNRASQLNGYRTTWDGPHTLRQFNNAQREVIRYRIVLGDFPEGQRLRELSEFVWVTVAHNVRRLKRSFLCAVNVNG